MTRQFYFQLVWLVFVCPNTHTHTQKKPLTHQIAHCHVHIFSPSQRLSVCWLKDKSNLRGTRISPPQCFASERAAAAARRGRHSTPQGWTRANVSDTSDPTHWYLQLGCFMDFIFFLRIAKKKIQECVSLFLFLKYLFTFCFICDRMLPIQGSRLRERACIH